MTDHADARAALVAATRAARERWPAIALSVDEFVDGLIARGPSASELCVSDLYLAAACARGDAAALAAFDAELLADLPGMLSHLGASPALVDEVRGALREKLFTGERPRITAYAGTADLHGWLRVVATRVAIDLLRRDGRHVAVGDDALVELAADADDPELALVKATARDALAAAFAEAVATLSPKQRNLLRYQTLDRLGIDQIAALYGVHRATAARWVESARDALVARTRRILVAKLRVDGAELDSIVRLVRSRLDLSLSRLFASST